MRSIMNISLPATVKAEVEQAVQQGLYASKSEFIRDMLRIWKEERLLQELRESQQQIARGKGRVLRSLKALR